MTRVRSRVLSETSPPRAVSSTGGKARRTASQKRNEADGARAQRGAARRDAILASALEEFSSHGFEATRLDDVARRAGIAKGTIYLYFTDKETLFQELVRSHISPVIGALEHVSHVDAPLNMIAEQFVELFAREVIETRRKDVIRLVLSEGPRFPKLAEFYYREVVARGLAAVRGVLKRAVERGELPDDTLLRNPQLLVAPALVAILWNALFEKFEPLDVRALLRAHFKILFGAGRAI